MNTNNGVKWRRFIVPKKVEQINDHLFIDTYRSNNITIGVIDNTDITDLCTPGRIAGLYWRG